VFVGAETVVAVAYEVARIRLENLAGAGWLVGASSDAYREWGSNLARIGPLGSATGLSRLVDVRFRQVVTNQRSAVLAMRWEAVGSGGGLFPVLDADITLAPYRQSATLLSLTGAYRPPLGVIGAVLDRVVLHRVATATVQDFVDRIGNAVADPAGAGVPEAAGVKPGRTREPRPGC
jgi:hypothetical protein